MRELSINTPLNLRRFQVLSGPDESTVRADLLSLLIQTETAERSTLTSPDFAVLADVILNGRERVVGSKNSWARTRLPAYSFPCQPYNMNEMLRTLVVNKIEVYAQSVGLFAVMTANSHETDPAKVMSLYSQTYPSAPAPRYQVVRAHLHRYHEKGQRQTTPPTAAAMLPLWACDTHHSKIVRDGDFADLSIALPSGRAVLRFTLPSGSRFDGKVSRPTITLENCELLFTFSVISKVERRQTNRVLGIDLGKVEPFVATVIDPETRKHSAPLFAERKVNRQVAASERLFALADHLARKSDRCRSSQHEAKADILDTERRRVLAAAGRHKDEATRAVGAQIASLAQKYDATPTMERLSFLNSLGGKWNHAEVQSFIENGAKRRGYAAKKVNARNTSQECSRCGAQVTHSRRNNVCRACRFTLNRDVAASRNIALRGTKIRMRNLLRQRSSTETQPPKPVPAGLEARSAGPRPEDNGLATLTQVRRTTTVDFPT